MLKFMVVVCKRPDMSGEEFRRYLRDVHGPLAKKLPGLKRYVQNFVAPDAKRKPPAWDAVIELYFEDRVSMEAAWASPEGARPPTLIYLRSLTSVVRPGLWLKKLSR